jgi:hypothetical protein
MLSARFFKLNSPTRALRIAISATIGAVVLPALQTASADVIGLSYSATSPGSSGTIVTTGSGVNTTLAVPGSHTFGDTLGSLSTPVYTTGSGQTFEFYDDYVFTITGANVNVLTSSINLGSLLGLDSFQVRLYSAAGNATLPVFGTPATGTLLEAWSVPVNLGPSTGLIALLPEYQLNPGTYVLEVRGNVSGQFGGSYSGVMNLAPAPVPLPAAAWLLLSGLGGLGALGRRRK